MQHGAERKLLIHVVVKYFLLAFQALYSIWRKKTVFFSASELVAYKKHVDVFRECWVSLSWKPIVWVHWTTSHSLYFIEKQCSLFAFSSIIEEVGKSLNLAEKCGRKIGH